MLPVPISGLYPSIAADVYQNKAYDFYVNKLGFKVHTDAKMDNGYRWLTVCPPEQPDLEIALLTPLTGGMGYDEETTRE